MAVTIPRALRSEPLAESWLPLGMWGGVVAVGIAWGSWAAGPDVRLAAAPFAGSWHVRFGPGIAAGALLALTVVMFGPALARRLAWGFVPVGAGVTAVLMAVVLATVDGWARLSAPLSTRYEYEPFAATITSARGFVQGFVDAVPDMPTHVKAHPPLATLVPWALDRMGLAGAGWFAALVIGCWGVAVGAALVAARAVGGEARARRAAPALVLLPAALWAATSADAMFAGVGAVGIALAVARPGKWRFAAGGGVVLGVALLLSYGAALLLLIPTVVAVTRRNLDDLVPMFLGVAVVLAAAAMLGFWWLDGLTATRAAYWDGVAGRRPIAYLAIAGNPAALALAVGPATAIGLARHRCALVIGGIAAVALADLSLLSAGEVERIWLPFMPWLALAAPGDHRVWLGVQSGALLGLAVILRSWW